MCGQARKWRRPLGQCGPSDRTFKLHHPMGVFFEIARSTVMWQSPGGQWPRGRGNQSASVIAHSFFVKNADAALGQCR